MHDILVIAEKQTFGDRLEALLHEHGYDTTVVETFGRFSNVLDDLTRPDAELVIATNTTLTPVQIEIIVKDIKAMHPRERIVVLSGYCNKEFVSDLKRKGIDGFLPLPIEDEALLRTIDGIFSTSASR